jgi:signal transduction histidine kinase
VDLSAVAADVVEFYEPMAEEKGVSLEFLPASTPPPCLSGDRSLLFEALGNLVDNALKYTPGGGRVTVRNIGEDGRPGFEVSDSGPGIPASERDAVFRRFHRVEESRNAPGTGLGLALVAAVARLHCMDISIADAMPGCRITLTWRGDGNGMAIRGEVLSAS